MVFGRLNNKLPDVGQKSSIRILDRFLTELFEFSVRVVRFTIIYFYTAIIGVLLIFSTKIAYFKHHHLTSDVTRDIGIAFIVAFVVIITIEQRQRKEFSRTVSEFLAQTHEKLFQTVLGVEFPEEMYVFVRDEIMKSNFFRKGTVVHYKLKKAEGSKEDGHKYKITTKTEYYTHNLTGRDQVFESKYFVSKDVTDSMSLKFWINDVEVSEDDMMRADDDWKDTDQIKRYKHNVVISANGHKKMSFLLNTKKMASDTSGIPSFYDIATSL